MGPRGSVSVFLCIAMLSLWLPASLLAQGGWQPETRLTNNPDTSNVGPNNGKYLAADGKGNVHIVWIDYRNKGINVYHKMKSGGIWSADEPVTSNRGSSVRPMRPVVALDRSGALHLVWNDNRTGNMEIYHKMWSGGWGDDEQVTSTPELSFGASIATEGDTLHIVYMERISGHLQIMYRRYVDLEWSPGLALTDIPTGDRMVPTLARGRDNSLHVAWWDTRSDTLVGKIYYRAKVGDIWLDEECLTNPANGAMRPNIAVDESLGVHVVWIDARATHEQIYYRYHGAGGWEPEVALTNEQATHYHPSIGVAGGDVFVAYWDNHLSETNPEVFFKRKTEGAWSGRFQVSNGAGPSTFCCLITEPNKNFHVAWVDERDGNMEMYYRDYVDPSNGIEGGEEEPIVAPLPCYLRVCPNPFRGSTKFELSVPSESDASLRIYTVDGRCVRRVLTSRLPDGIHSFAWDGRDDRGRDLAPGAYFAVGRVGKMRISEKIILLK